MKVILIKDVARLGRRSEVKEVPSGHATNFLIPRKLAIPATPENMKRLRAEVKKHDELVEHSQKLFEDALVALSEKTILYKTEANEQGNLYKGINAEDIVKILESECSGISKNNIVLAQPIKHIGQHSIELIHKKKQGSFTLEVVKK